MEKYAAFSRKSKRNIWIKENFAKYKMYAYLYTPKQRFNCFENARENHVTRNRMKERE